MTDQKVIASYLCMPTKFHVHGIWPSNFSDIEVTCGQALTNNPFDKAQMTPLQTDLVNSWPSVLITKSNMWFWEHEYENHGACTVESGVPQFTQKSYFEKGHQLWNQYDIHSVLDQSGIKPSTAKSYTMTQLSQQGSQGAESHRKNIKHSLIEIAEIMKTRSMAKDLSGIVKENRQGPQGYSGMDEFVHDLVVNNPIEKA
ncbi:extracellular ribonuclease LE-like [Rosa chinensis]|uniref:extracellular ribonuclease LE-like n=1 Tax=Rosa chinensis TaxID=74649 RepID=UPI001AD92B28|nr:extracellular ribonuclease LE-like [Rosa chinensis]